MRHSCGIDWASDHHDVSIVNERGIEVKRMRIEDSLKDYRELVQILRDLGGEIPIAIECKEHLLISFLVKEGFPVYSLNPKSVERYKDRYNVGGTKTDPVDAFALADILRTDRHKYHPLIYSSPEVRKLQLIYAEYEKLLKDQNALSSQLQDVLLKYYPLLLTLFYKKNCKILYRTILEYPTYTQLKKAGHDELKAFLRRCHHNRNRYIEQIYQKIQDSEYHHVDEFDEVYSSTAKALANTLLVLRDHVDEMEKRMIEITKRHALGEIFHSIPGSGDINSARLLAVMGDNKELYSECSAVQSYTGVAPIMKSSGKSCRVVFRYSCNKLHRDALTWFAFCTLLHCKWARAFYDRKRKEGKGHFESCRILAYKWLRIIFTLWKRGEKYDEAVHIENMRKYSERRLKIA